MNVLPRIAQPFHALWNGLLDVLNRAVWLVLTVRRELFGYFIPPELAANTEPNRHARLIVGFGFLGTIFGAFYALFYLAIGHRWGAAIVIVCSAVFGLMPFVMRRQRAIQQCGNVLAGILTLGFVALCSIEGGLNGHAIAWLCAVPLCALLLAGRLVAITCAAACCLATVGFIALDAAGLPTPFFYAPRWHFAVTSVGMLTLPIFMGVLGLIFENGRRRAMETMSAALQELGRANGRLIQMNQDKNDFLGMVTHDLKNPLNAVLGFGEMISQDDGGSPERTRGDARVIVSAAQRMIEMIEHLLDINAIEQGRFELDLRACDLRVLHRQVLANYQMAAAKKQISIYAAEPAEPLWARVDAKATVQVFDNLLSNALKYSPLGADVLVRLRRSVEGVLWQVEDHGAGLSAAEQAKLFQKFTRLGPRPTAGESSSGLGLSIVKQLCVMMGATVECQSAPGQGSTFTFRAPEIAAPAAEKSADAGSEKSDEIALRAALC